VGAHICFGWLAYKKDKIKKKKMNPEENNLVSIPSERVISKIFIIRGKKVMVDADLAELYEVEARALNQAVKRNADRFPDDFMFQLTEGEYKILRSQIVILKNGRGQHRKYLPYVFTEQGVAMLSSVLNSKRAIQVNIQIIRSFIKLRELLSTNKELREKIEEMEMRYDTKLKAIFEVLGKLLIQEDTPEKKIGFLRE
jgi:phage regulator Rha-like protein